MPIARFPYISLPLPADDAHPSGSIAHRPLAFATITAVNRMPVRYIVMPDSGADACLFPLRLAKSLGLDVLQLPQGVTGGLGASANTTYWAPITVDLGNGIEFSAYAGFTQGMDRMGLGLLGQLDFFDRFRVEFDLSKRVFTIETAGR
jgi:hypothetical protein